MKKSGKELKNQKFEMMKEEIEAIIKMEHISLNNLVDKIPFNKEKLIQTNPVDAR